MRHYRNAHFLAGRLCSWYVLQNGAHGRGRRGNRDEHEVDADGENAARVSRGGKADARLRNSRKRGRLPLAERGKGKILAGLAPRKALISLDSVPEIEGNGKIWKPLSRRLCEKTRFDCGVQRAPGAFLKEDGFAFTESHRSKKRQARELSAARAARASARPSPNASSAGPASSSRLERAGAGRTRSTGEDGEVGRSAENVVATH